MKLLTKTKLLIRYGFFSSQNFKFFFFFNFPFPQNLSNSKLSKFVRGHAFEKLALGSYIVYIVSLMCDYYQRSIPISLALHYVQLVLSILLIIEVMLRVFAYRKEFFANSWNRFDVVLVIFMIIGKLSVHYKNERQQFTLFFVQEFVLIEVALNVVVSISTLRVLRIFRFNALIASSSKNLQRCGRIVARTWNTVSMLYALLFVVICVYAIIGMILYGKNKIEFGSVDIINFESFGQSLIILIQVT